MNPVGITFTVVAAVFLLTLPRRYAAIPLLLGATYMTRGQVLEVGQAHLTVMRLLVAVGILRVLLKGERFANGMNRLDQMVLLWAIVLVGTSVFHTSDAWVFRIGIVWSDLGCYLLFRFLIHDVEDVRRIFKALCLILVPIAVMMLLEKYSGRNAFAFLEGVGQISATRDGHVRANGPFTHAILAGTVGATCLGMACYLWKRDRNRALFGLFAGGGIVYASGSSGPVMMVLLIALGLALWKLRTRLRAVRWLALSAVIALDAIMKDPVYFLMARIDITGGSTGWHRARLIQSSMEHLDEWWLGGTDYTRHWMPTGIPANDMHTDITNHILAMGVMGGLSLMILFIIVLVVAFHLVGRALREHESASTEDQFRIWVLGAILFGHVMNFFTISLFDQSIVFFYLILAAIGGLQGAKLAARTTAYTIRRTSTDASL